MIKSAGLILAFLIGSVTMTTVMSDGGYGDRNSPLAPYHELIEAQDYQAAIDKLTAALAEEPDDADLLNLLAFSQRKLMRFDEAMVNYQKALQIKPKHLGANEYLGELYLQLGQPEQAEERLQVLDKACFFGCDEYDELKQAIEAYRSKNSS
jgi:tetratricopeptide (TPR) repeat protein